MSDWQPIETAPSRTVVLARCNDVNNGSFLRLVMSLFGSGHWTTVPGLWRVYPTHWMPLPDPPTPTEVQG